MNELLTVVLWNVFWRRPSSSAGRAIRRIISDQKPDIVCLTECQLGLLDDNDAISSGPDYGSIPIMSDRCKVMLWSRQPWTSVDNVGRLSLPKGRFIAGTTNTVLGPVDVVGVCVPWDNAHVAGGRRDRRKWEEHCLYLDGLDDVLRNRTPSSNTIVLGDFNQAIPRKRAPHAVFEKLERVFQPNFDIATAGKIEGLRSQAIDHLSHGREFTTVDVRPLSNTDGDGQRLSDHIGLVVRLARLQRSRLNALTDATQVPPA